MKLLVQHLTILLYLSIAAAFPVDAEPSRDAEPTPDQLARVKNLIVTGTLKQIIGHFPSYGSTKVGDSFEIDLSKLPVGRIDFAVPKSDVAKNRFSYAPFQDSLIIDHVHENTKSVGLCVVRLSSVHEMMKFVVEVRASELKSGNEITVFFYDEAFGRINCMAEAQGVLK